MPSSVVDQAIKLSVAGNRRFNQILNVFVLSDIAVDERRLGWSLGNRSQGCRNGCAFVLVVAAHDHFGACLDKFMRAALANTAAATGDYHHLISVSQACHLDLRRASLISLRVPRNPKPLDIPSTNRAPEYFGNNQTDWSRRCPDKHKIVFGRRH